MSRAPKQSRDDFSLAVKRDLRDRAGGLCSQPQCRASTVGADASTTDGVSVVGIAAHIRAAAPGGPRYDSSQTAADRASIKNAIWLCPRCAALIDKNNGRNFSVARLLEWKVSAEKKSATALLFSGSLSRPDWFDRIHYLQFINIPRLATMLGNPNLVADLQLDPRVGFREQGMRLAPIMGWLERALSNASIEALPLEQVLPPSEDLIGQIISFEGRCYTKNGVDAGQTVEPKLLANFDPKRSPHFYMKAGLTRVIFPYDPLWITTSTAYCDFRNGATRFAGLGLVKGVNDAATEMFVSPLVVAFPKNQFMQMFYEGWAAQDQGIGP